MKVALVSLAFSPTNVTSTPGINRFVVNLSRGLRKAGVEVRVITPARRGDPDREIWEGIEVIRLKDTKTTCGPVGVIAGINFLSFESRLLNQSGILEDVDVLQTDIPLPKIRRISRSLPVILMFHHAYRVWTLADWLWVPFLMRRQSRSISVADRVVVPSHASANDVMRIHGIPESKIVVIHHGVDCDTFRKSDQPTPMRPMVGPRLLYVGILERRKGVLDLADVLRIVKSSHPEARLTIVGDGPDREPLRRRFSRQCLLPAVRFMKGISERDLIALLQEADIFVFPSRLEGFGFAAAEAMACEVPVVAYDTPASRELLGNLATLVGGRGIRDLALNVVSLASNPGERRMIGQAGRNRVLSMFSMESACLKYLQLYRDITLPG